MKLSEKAQIMLNRYIHELKIKLPRKKAIDISKEQHSNILDALEEEFGDNEINEQEMSHFLLKSGSPAKLAASFSEEKYLIGPSIYPLYSLILKIVLTVMGSLMLVAGLVFPGHFGISGLQDFLGMAWSLLISLFGSLTLAFWILQKFIKGADPDEDWTPAELSPVEQEEYPGNIPLAVFSVFLILVIVFLLFFLEYAGLIYSIDGKTRLLPVELTGFSKLIPWLVIVLLLRFVHTVNLFISQKWNSRLRYADILISLAASPVPLILFIRQAELKIISTQTYPIELNEVVRILSQIGRVGLLAIFLAIVISSILKALKLFNK